jgi:hypothetical protein
MYLETLPRIPRLFMDWPVLLIRGMNLMQSMCSKPENYDSTTKYTMTTLQATVSGTSTTCTISQVVFEGPA